MSDYDSKIIRKQIRVYGSVQGVGFRYRTEHAAESVGATGWVRNDPDGSVFMEIQGTEEQIDRVFAMVSQGTYVNIEKMDALASAISDYEDAVVEKVASRKDMDYIVTRNIKDYQAGGTKIILPDDFVKLVEEE